MKEKIIKLIEDRIDFLEDVIIESLEGVSGDTRRKLLYSIRKPEKIPKKIKQIKVNTEIVELATTKILELKSLLIEIKNLKNEQPTINN